MKYRAPRNVLRPYFLTACFLLCAKPMVHADDFSAWPNSSDVVLNTMASGANVAGTVMNFPVLVRLNSVNFPFSQSIGRGRDIRFAKPDGTPLAHEIERWDSTRATAEIWVRADTVRGSTAGQILKMYWGNPSATDVSNAANVFRAADNYTAAWHLGGPSAVARPNAVTGGNPAVPNNYDGNESVEGIIALSDSLDGGATGDFLDIGDGYTEYAAGFTYSVWVYPTAVKRYAHVLDLGNGQGNDNIIVTRQDTTASLGFHNYTGTSASYSDALPGQWVLNQWQHIAVTMTGRTVRIYKNGAQILVDTLSGAITGVNRTTNFLGKSNWAFDEYFQGRLDQPELSKAVRSADWINLAYQNQRSGQTLVTVVKNVICPVRFVPPSDTALAEGSQLSLEAGIECASSINWSIVSGPGPGILDPESRTLMLLLPRVAKDTAIVYRLTAVFPDSTRIRNVRVTIREAIPDPVFTLPVLPEWSGREAVPYRPVISNLAAIRASRDSIIHWNWTFSGLEPDTGWLADGVMLEGTSGEGLLNVKLCLDNGGAPACRNADINVTGLPTVLRAQTTARVMDSRVAPGRDALGRSPRKSGKPALHGFLVFRRE